MTQPTKEAQSPETPPARLAELAAGDDMALKRAVARNPNASLTTLISLAEHCAADVCDNAALPLLFLHDGEAIAATQPKPRYSYSYGLDPRTFLESLTAQDNCPLCVDQFVLNQVRRDANAVRRWKRLLRAVVLRGQLERDQHRELWFLANRQAELRSDDEPHLREADPEFFALLRRAHGKATKTKQALTADELSYLATLGAAARLFVARQANTPPNVLASILLQGEHAPTVATCWNPNTPPELLAEHARHRRDDVRAAVAGNTSTPVEALAILAEDIPGVAGYVASNANAPAELLARLARNAHEMVRKYVATNAALPHELVDALAGDRRVAVRRALAANPRLTAAAQSLLGHDKDMKVKKALGANPSSSLETLHRLARDPDKAVRVALAGRKATPIEVLQVLAQDSHKTVRKVVERNSSYKRHLKGAVKKKRSKKADVVKPSAAAKPKRPKKAAGSEAPLGLTELAAQLRNVTGRRVKLPEMEPAQLASMAAADLDARTVAAAHPATPQQPFCALVSDSTPSVRVAAARSPNLNDAQRRALLKDEDDFVVEAVIRHGRLPAKIQLEACRGRVHVRATLASAPRMRVATLMRLAKDRSVQVIKKLLARKSLQEQVLLQIAQHKDPYARRLAFDHPRLPTAWLLQHVHDKKDRWLRDKARMILAWRNVNWRQAAVESGD